MASLPPIGVLIVAVVLLLAGSGGYDVAINGAAMGDPGWSRPARLTLLHAAFSGGGAVGAISAGLAIGGDTAFAAVYMALAIALVAVAGVTVAARWGSAPPVGRVPRSVALLMLPLAALAGVAFLAEGSIETWSAIYLRDELGAAAVVGALGPAAFHAAMLVGRLFGAAIAGWLGSATTLLVAGVMGIAGMSVALLAGAAQLAIPAMGVAVLGASFVVPVVVSLAARRAEGYAGRAASYVLTLGYAGFLIGPSLVGIGGELFGLRVALVVVPAAAALVAITSRTSVARA